MKDTMLIFFIHLYDAADGIHSRVLSRHCQCHPSVTARRPAKKESLRGTEISAAQALPNMNRTVQS
jgi:hypothetical protein